MGSPVVRSKLTRLIAFFTLLTAYLLAMPPTVHAQQSGAPTTSASAQAHESQIPVGTILPVVLRTAFSFESSKPGEILHGKIAQAVPLPDGTTIRKGSVVEGHIIEVIPGNGSNPAKVSLQFDKLYLNGHPVNLVTNLRAIASFMAIQDAGVPEEAPNEGSPYNWLVRRQIGGDSVYGDNGPVISAENTSEVIGKSVNDGVLVRVSSRQGTRCRGPVGGNDRPQALWVFSDDACGTYGLSQLQIVHSGRTSPKGVIVLSAEHRDLKLRSGDGLLLRVD